MAKVKPEAIKPVAEYSLRRETASFVFEAVIRPTTPAGEAKKQGIPPSRLAFQGAKMLMEELTPRELELLARVIKRRRRKAVLSPSEERDLDEGLAAHGRGELLTTEQVRAELGI